MPEEVPALSWVPQAAAPSGVSRALLCPALQDGPQQLQTHPTMGALLTPSPGGGTEGHVDGTSLVTRCPLRFTSLEGRAGCIWRLGGREMWVSELSCVFMSCVLNCIKKCNVKKRNNSI